MKNLGRAVIVFFCVVFAFSAEVKVDKSHILKGESVTLTITAEGENVKFPALEKIGKYPVEAISVSKNAVTKNGKVFRSVSKYYTFTPLESMTVPSFTVVVNGKEEKTEPLKIEVKKESVNGKKDFYLDMYVNKKEAYVGEPLKLTIVFRKKIGVDIQDLDFTPPPFENFWAKELVHPSKEITGSYVVQKIEYILFPQKDGKLYLSSAVLNIGLPQRGEGIFNMIFNRVAWRKIYSNPLYIDVKPLPKGVKVFGKFDMRVTVDKKEVSPNEAVNVEIEIKGEGNVEDIDPFKLKLKDAAVYTDEPVKRGRFENGRYLGEFKQKFAVVSDKSFKIPSFVFSYFDKNEKRVKSLRSEPILVKVRGALNNKEERISLQKAPAERKELVFGNFSGFRFYLFAGIVFFMGFVIGYFVKNIKFRRNDKRVLPIEKKIKEAKNDKELLKALLPYVNRSKEIEEIVFALEGNLYNGGNYKIDKKSLSKNISKYLKGKNKKEEFEELI